MHRRLLSRAGTPTASGPNRPWGALNTGPRATNAALAVVFSSAPELLPVAPVACAARKAQIVDEEHAHCDCDRCIQGDGARGASALVVCRSEQAPIS